MLSIGLAALAGMSCIASLPGALPATMLSATIEPGGGRKAR